jgi:hypothetical protein
MHLGPDDVLLAISVDFKDRRTTDTIERAITEIEAEIKTRWPSIRRVFLEVQSEAQHKKLEAQSAIKAPAGH